MTKCPHSSKQVFKTKSHRFVIDNFLKQVIIYCPLGTILTQEDYLNNKEWLKRIETMFITIDHNKSGFITVNDVVINVRKYSHLNSDPKLIENVRAAQTEFAAVLGIVPGISLTKEEYVSAYAKIAPGEVAKVRSGEGSAIHKMLNRIFDLFDTTYDGIVSKERYRNFVKVCEMFPPSYIDSIYDFLDTKKTGKVERKEICDYQYKVTFTLEGVAGSAKVLDVLKPV